MTYIYKIDIDYSEYMVSRKLVKWFTKWERMKSFKTHEEAKEYIKMLRGFPEYYE